MEESLYGKTVAVTGCTGGLGQELCRHLLERGARLVMLDRSLEKSAALEKALLACFPAAEISRIPVDLSRFSSVASATEALLLRAPDLFIHNAGAYSIPREITDTGYDNVFQINFLSPYYMARRLHEGNAAVRIMAVGSIAHTYSVLDESDIDFHTRGSAAKVYGNAKRFLMLALSEYGRASGCQAVLTHPGISFTGITAHYPKPLFLLIKYPMKLIFMKPKKAVLPLVRGACDGAPCGYWWGPRFFGIWGKPRLTRLSAAFTAESKRIYEIAEELYKKVSKM